MSEKTVEGRKMSRMITRKDNPSELGTFRELSGDNDGW
jgi:hypothetical protein